MPRLEDPFSIGGVEVPNRLYRAPLLECAGNGEDAVDRLIADLEPAAASGAGLICQGAMIVSPEGGCAAPNMTRVHDPDFAARLERLTDRIHDHGTRVFAQLEEGGLRSMETWHAGYRADNPELEQLAVSEPPLAMRLADRAGALEYDPHVMSTDEVYDLARRFGEAAGHCAAAGYDGIHLAGANMGIVQQFLSPYYNRRDDEFGGALRDRLRFLEVVYDQIRGRTSIPVTTKVPAETAAPPFVRRHLTREDGVQIAAHLDRVGYDALVPVETSTFWDMSIIRGGYPDRAWADEGLQDDYASAFGGRVRAKAVALANRVHARGFEFEPAWNAGFCRAVRERVSVPTLCEGGIRERPRMDRLLGDACDAVGMARPFYAEPRLPARLLGDEGARVVCESCNNCTIPQAAGEPGVCRTPSVLERRGQYEKAGAYERTPDAGADD
jgi:2,4-dienoyl-CoA reductase-like NADH-dependent reductase (Old Yellow Enzyme family)